MSEISQYLSLIWFALCWFCLLKFKTPGAVMIATMMVGVSILALMALTEYRPFLARTNLYVLGMFLMSCFYGFFKHRLNIFANRAGKMR